MDTNEEIMKCKYCGGYDYWGEFRWKNGRQMCRRCYSHDWEDRNGGKLYPWTDLDGPFPAKAEKK